MLLEMQEQSAFFLPSLCLWPGFHPPPSRGLLLPAHSFPSSTAHGQEDH